MFSHSNTQKCFQQDQSVQITRICPLRSPYLGSSSMSLGLGLPYLFPPCPSHSPLSSLRLKFCPFQEASLLPPPVTVHFSPPSQSSVNPAVGYFLIWSCKTIYLLKAWLWPYHLSGKSLSTMSCIRCSVSITSGHLPRSPLKGMVMSSLGVGRTGLLGFEELKSGSQPETRGQCLHAPHPLFITTSPPQRWALAVPFQVRACDFQILINAPWWKNSQASLG